MPVHAQRAFDLADAEVGEVLRAARTRRGLSLRAAAVLAGIDWRVLCRIESGGRPCRVTELLALAEAYGSSANRLLRAIMGNPAARRSLSLGEHPDGPAADSD